MDTYLLIGQIALRSLLSVFALFIISRIIGARQISQLTFYDYIVGISIGSIAAVAVDSDIPYLHIIVAMIVFGGFTTLLELLTSKSMILRRVLSGKPSVLIYGGKIIKKSLKQNKYDINDLLLSCRQKGYFNIDDIECAVLETDGELSVLPKSNKRPMNPQDNNLAVPKEDLQYNIIIDGKVLQRNLDAYGKDQMWLNDQLKQQNIKNAADVLLAAGTTDGKLFIYLQNEELPHNDFFM